MALFSKKINPEKRAGSNENVKNDRTDFSGEELLHAILSDRYYCGSITKAEALNIPSVQSCINYISNAVSMLPIKLYKDNGGKAEEVRDDRRIRLLNDDTGDALDAVQFWRAMIADYWLGKGGYAYIKRSRNEVVSLHYVDESAVSIHGNNNPVMKDFNILYSTS